MRVAAIKKLVTAGGLLSALVFLYIIARSIIFFYYQDVVVWPDSEDYTRISNHSIWSEDLWMARRPPVYPILIKSFSDTRQLKASEPPLLAGLLGYRPNLVIGRGLEGDPEFVQQLATVNVTALSVFQFVVSIFSWCVFALVCTKPMNQTWLRLLGAAVILLIGLDQNVTIWDRHILTESFSISLFLLIVSLSLSFIRKAQGEILFLACVIAFFYAGMKGTNPYMLLALSFLIYATPLLQKRQWKIGFVLCGSAFLTFAAFNIYSADKGYRGVVPLMNVLNSRVIAEGYEDIYEAFRGAGMPEVPQTFYEQHWYAPFDSVPGLEDWLLEKGPGVYKQYLITHPGYLFVRPFTTPVSKYNLPVYRYYDSYLALYGQSQAIGTTVFFGRHSFVVFLLVGIATLLVARKRLKRVNSLETIFFAYIFVSGILLSLVVWHGDVIENSRHMMQVTIQLRLAIVLIVLYCINTFYSRTMMAGMSRQQLI